MAVMPDPCTCPEVARLREALDKAERERDAAQATLDRPMGALAAERIVAACERKIAAAEQRAADAEAMAEAQRQLHAAALKERDEAEQRARDEAARADGLAEELSAAHMDSVALAYAVILSRPEVKWKDARRAIDDAMKAHNNRCLRIAASKSRGA